MNASRIAWVVLGTIAALLTLGAQCGTVHPLRTLAPTNGSTVTWMPLDLTIDMSADADPATLSVLLNGVEVAGALTLATVGSRQQASVDDLWADGLLLPGTNQLDASVDVNGVTKALSITFEAVGDPYADAVEAFTPGTRAGFGQNELPAVVLGGPHGIDLYNGSLDVLSLGIGGVLDLEFVDNAVVDGPGVDFSVFENAFMTMTPGLFIGDPFSEPARVSVSQDGVTWHAFPCADDPLLDAPWFPGCAGVRAALSDVDDPSHPHPSIPTGESYEALVGLPVLTTPFPAGAGGDSYDLADVGLAWARFVRLEASAWDAGLCCETNAGPDIDAVAAVHSVPGEDLDANGVPDALE